MSKDYEKYDVSSSKPEVHAATKDNDKGLFPKAFCKINPAPRGGFFGRIADWINPLVSINSSDGAGTKAALAYMYWKETGDISVWHGVVQDSIVMNLDDILCAGGIAGELHLTSNIDRNTKRIPGEVLAELINGENYFLHTMRLFGININGQCGETADVPDLTPTILINNAMHCRMKKRDVINNGNIAPGQKVVGLASHGQATYEDSYNGGARSNGYTRMRHDLIHPEYRWKYPETYNGGFGMLHIKELKEIMRKNYRIPTALQNDLEKHIENVFVGIGENAYNGTKKLTDLIKVETDEQIPFGKLALSPTRTYAPICRDIYREIGNRKIKGMVHNSGGGMTKVLNYLSRPMTIIKDNLFDMPALFGLIQAETGAQWKGMYEDFNMGCGFEIYVEDEKTAEKIQNIAMRYNVASKIIGEVAHNGSDKPSVIISGVNGTFSYSR
ncbi:MAG: hypothetical protein LBG89_01185 [Rickettsiales bacterium]|jgi:phosphoribosylformylglycinamidine cyclo-ligase|nr:hypothetical protein [Rickettsiales bacterium]